MLQPPKRMTLDTVSGDACSDAFKFVCLSWYLYHNLWWYLLFLSTAARLSAFFFFQAEDGIRDLTVTGVQTCALPISSLRELVDDAAEIRRIDAAACGPEVTLSSPRAAGATGVVPSTCWPPSAAAAWVVDRALRATVPQRRPARYRRRVRARPVSSRPCPSAVVSGSRPQSNYRETTSAVRCGPWAIHEDVVECGAQPHGQSAHEHGSLAEARDLDPRRIGDPRGEEAAYRRKQQVAVRAEPAAEDHERGVRDRGDGSYVRGDASSHLLDDRACERVAAPRRREDGPGVVGRPE